MRAAMVGGAGYLAGKKGAQSAEAEQQQQQQPQQQQAPPPAAPAPAAGGTDVVSKLKELSDEGQRSAQRRRVRGGKGAVARRWVARWRSGPFRSWCSTSALASPTGVVLEELSDSPSRHRRLLDLLVLRRHEDGQFEAFEAKATPDGGAKVAVLTGLHAGDDGDAPESAGDEGHEGDLYVADAIPPGKTVAVGVARAPLGDLGLRDQLQGRGGELLAEAWVHPLQPPPWGSTPRAGRRPPRPRTPPCRSE